MKVKVVFGDDVRRWREPESGKYSALKTFVQDAFNFLDDSSFIIQYLDDENDKITISCEKDFEDAFVCAQKEKRKSLKLFVSIAKSDLNLLKGESVDIDISSSDDCLSTDNSSLLSGEEEEDNVKSPKNQDSNCTYWRESALNFLQNKEIGSLLPEFVRRVVIALKNEQNKGKNVLKQEEKKMDDNEDLAKEKEESKDFSTILIEILSEDKFKAIANHELIENKLPFILPFISEKVLSYQHLLFLLNENVISTWIPHLISILIDGLLKYENVSFDIEMDNNGDGGCDISSFIPQWFAYVTNENDTDKGEENEKEKEKEEIIHNGVICDSCNKDGILGVRYKCLVCIDYDLCEKCCLSGKHDSSHPLIKLNLPFEKINEKGFEYGGLHETIRQLGGRRRVFGGPFGRFGRGRGRGRRGRGGRGRFGRGGFGHHGYHGYHPYDFHHGHGHHGYEQHNEAPFAFNQDEGFGYQGHEFEEFEGFSESPCGPYFAPRGRGRGRRFGGRGGHFGFGHFAHHDHPHPHPHHQHHEYHPHGRHGGQRRFTHGKHERKNFKRELKSQRKEYKNELKNLKKLEKQMAKQCCRVDKQINKLNKQQAKEKAKKQATKEKGKGQKLCNDVLCICGETLVNVKASDAYPESSGSVRCDICDCKRVGDSFIYHCPNNGALLHPSGYDICNRCAKTQQKSFVKNDKKDEKQSEKNEKKKEVKDNKGKKDKKDKKGGKKNKNSNDLGLASVSSLVEEEEEPSIVSKDEIEDITIVKGDEFKQEEDDMDVEVNVDNADNVKDENVKDEVYENKKKDDFIFVNELSQLEAMGFGNDEHIRALLIAKKGNVGNVIQALFQSA